MTIEEAIEIAKNAEVIDLPQLYTVTAITDGRGREIARIDEESDYIDMLTDARMLEVHAVACALSDYCITSDVVCYDNTDNLDALPPLEQAACAPIKAGLAAAVIYDIEHDETIYFTADELENGVKSITTRAWSVRVETTMYE